MTHRMMNKQESIFRDAMSTQIRGFNVTISLRVDDVKDMAVVSIFANPNQRADFKGSTLDQRIHKASMRAKLHLVKGADKAAEKARYIAGTVNKEVRERDLDSMARAIIMDYRQERPADDTTVEVVWTHEYSQVTVDRVLKEWVQRNADSHIGDVMDEAKVALSSHYGKNDTYSLIMAMRLARETGKTKAVRRALDDLYTLERTAARAGV